MPDSALPGESDHFLGDHVFVYGTLRRGFINNEATLAFRNGAEFVAAGTAAGALYSTGWYPALIEGQPGVVTGEVWKLVTPGLMDILDDYEGLFDDPQEYVRERRAIITAAGEIAAWVYLYLHPVDPAQLIPSGDWSDAFATYD